MMFLPTKQNLSRTIQLYRHEKDTNIKLLVSGHCANFASRLHNSKIGVSKVCYQVFSVLLSLGVASGAFENDVEALAT